MGVSKTSKVEKPNGIKILWCKQNLELCSKQLRFFHCQIEVARFSKSWQVRGTGVTRSQENISPLGLYSRPIPGPYGGPRGGAVSYERGAPVPWFLILDTEDSKPALEAPSTRRSGLCARLVRVWGLGLRVQGLGFRV